MRRLFVALGTAVLTAVSFAFSAPAEARPKPRGDLALQVLSFNDFHGHLEPPTGSSGTLGAADTEATPTPVGGAEYLASTLSRLRAESRHSHTVAAGDLIGGTPFLSGLFHDEPAVESLNAMGLDVSSVGNHEFDEGEAELLRMQRGGCHPVDGCYPAWGEGGYPGADFPWLAANVVRTATGRTVLPGTWVRTVDGVKVGYIGMTLEATPTLVAQSGIQGLEFRDEVQTANRAARALKRQGVETIVVLLHEGGLQTGKYNDCVGISGPIVSIAQNLHAEIDLVVTGHTHQPYVCDIADPRGQLRKVTSASSFGRVVTETVLPINRRTGEVWRAGVTATNHKVLRTTADPVQTEIISRWKALADPIANRVVGSITTDIRQPSRGAEGPLANLIADAQLAATSSAANGGAQIALMNPGGVRADLTYAPSPAGEQPGQVTYGEAFTVQPFGNTLVTMDLTGAQIEQLLEQQGSSTTRDSQLIFGVSQGLTFTWNASGPAGDHIDPASIQLNGTPLDAAASYRIVTNSFLAEGGDAFTVFREGTNRVGGGDDLEALLDYLGANSPVSPPEDRIAGA